ncbi:CynX/NimT family MFS transporter [Mediterraneibacter massiliensis]|uniref:MFS transporter n=1 Tax=Mediterraneibacter massiliensis TaxID=1720300 RepID=UPI000E4C6A42|nr:MFS transporter [Mediterraneibacter massiliensis]RGT73805.1 MFS transporter [Ruminococcus sp. AF18-22]
MQEKVQNRKKYICLFLFCICSFAMNLYSAQLSPLAGQLMDKFRITRVQYTSLYMSTLLPSLLLGIPCAWAVKRFGIKKCQCIGMGIGLAGLILRLFFDEFNLFYLFTLLLGFANVVISTMGVATFTQGFKKESAGVVTGIMIAFGAGGKALAELTTALFPVFWQMTVMDILLQCTILAAWIFFMDDLEPVQTQTTVGQTFRQIMKDRYIWIGAVALMLVFGLYTGISAHLPSILSKKGYDTFQGGFITSFISIGYFVGAVTLPKLTSLLRKKKNFMMLLAATGSLFTVLAAVNTNKEILILCVFIIGLCVGGLLPLSLAIPVSILQFDTQKSQTAGSLLTTFQLAGAVLIPTYVIVPLAENNANAILIYTAILMAVEGILFYCLPKSKQQREES